jgi:hypothetical protein
MRQKPQKPDWTTNPLSMKGLMQTKTTISWRWILLF